MDFDPSLLADLPLLAETVDLECKLAHGEHGKGSLPKDFWQTYSAMANAQGGVVLLGIREQAGRFTVAGLPEPERVRQDLFNNLNNRQKVSANLLTERSVTLHQVDGQTVMAICIPPAGRRQRPVYLNGQPLGHTWRRLHDGDRLCDDETVKRMLVEQLEEERDRRILPRFDLSDIEPESLRVYRQMLRDEKPGHPYLEMPDGEFLRAIRGWRSDRESGEEGLTLAGLLMFGRWEAIQEAVPHYFVDYQERPEARTERRGVDRLVPDGSWSGNVFDFYRRVYRKLVADLKVPFALKDGQRQDDTPVHQALREALVNTLVHADYTGRVSLLVVKRPDMFGFRNPGGLRLPLSQVLAGGESDCRNRLMHQMFLMIGTLPDGRDILYAGSKWGWIYALDPDAGGEVLWQRKVGEGGDLGGIMYGPSADTRTLYVPVADTIVLPPKRAGGLAALDLATGKVRWQLESEPALCSWQPGVPARCENVNACDCSSAKAAATTAMPGAVFAGGVDDPPGQCAPGSAAPARGRDVQPVELEQAVALVGEADAAEHLARRVFGDREPAAHAVVVLLRLHQVGVVVVDRKLEAVLLEHVAHDPPGRIAVPLTRVGDDTRNAVLLFVRPSDFPTAGESEIVNRDSEIYSSRLAMPMML